MSESTPSKPGAPKGNTNALKHGLYAKHFTPAEREHLGKMSPMDSIHEVHLLRLTLEKVLSMIESCEDEDRLIKLYNTLYQGTQRLMTAMRTNSLLLGDNQEILTSFWEAVEIYRREHDLK
jgi:hypothetical protein